MPATGGDGSALGAAEVDAFLERVDLDPDAVRADAPSLDTLRRLLSAHVHAIPFENLAIVDDPAGAVGGEGVTLDVPHLHRKIVERGRGGFCFELNGLFAAVLDALGYEVDLAAARILRDGKAPLPANHATVVVSLDRQYVADAGHGWPQMARPTPLDGDPTGEDGTGVSWRVVESDRPDVSHEMQSRVDDEDWEPRYAFGPSPRDLSYFRATCDYLASAPESWFATNTVVRQRTENGWKRLSADTFTRVEDGERTERAVDAESWVAVAKGEFGLSVGE